MFLLTDAHSGFPIHYNNREEKKSGQTIHSCSMSVPYALDVDQHDVFLIAVVLFTYDLIGTHFRLLLKGYFSLQMVLWYIRLQKSCLI